MAGRRTNLALLGSLVVALATGGLAFALGTPAGRLVVVAHGAAGLALVLLVPWKSAVARRGLARRRPGRGASVPLAVLVAAAVASGTLHAMGVGAVGPVTAMQLHVGAALAAVPLLAWHATARRVRPRRTDLSRRNALRAGALACGAGLAWAGLEGVARVAGLPGAGRRFTGSLRVESADPDHIPVTQWLDDRVPAIDPAGWRLEVRAGSRRRTLTYGELGMLADGEPGRRTDAVEAALDCTGGWYATARWEGVRLDRLLAGMGEGQSILVTSRTGYQRRLPFAAAGSLLLATRVAGRPLSAGHGFPARLVVPGRRGFWWVKWVTSIEVDATPAWRQPPFPLS
ncbi:MAG TPA: molybdopterin-dependent oxidoreductase [Actinomycetota bacterium]|nr:molybdopterin-dependent oxidoreductase [Actinomycetota bacterium]